MVKAKGSSLYQEGIGDHSDFTQSREETNDQIKGNAFSPADHYRTWEKCVVQEVYPSRHTCDVYTERGKFLSGVAWPENGEKAPKRGDLLAAHFQMGTPVLESIRANTPEPASEVDTPRMTPIDGVGGENPYYEGGGEGNKRGNRPKDILPGDRVLMGDEGNLLGILSGGSMLFKAGDLAQIIATQANHLLRLIGKNLRLDTGAGTLNFETKDGKSTITLRAGSDEETESSPTAENFRIRCEIGAEGELVDFRVTDARGRTKYRLHVDPDGRVQTKSQRKTEIIEEDRRTEVGTDDYTSVGGAKVEDVAGEKASRVGGGYSTDVGGHLRFRAASDAAMNSMHDLILSAARNVSLSSSGDPQGNDPSTQIDVVNGDLKIDIGNPLKGDAQIRNSGLDVDVVTGNISFQTQLGEFKASTRKPGSVKLGGPAPGLFSGMVYELFSSFMQVFGTMIDTHVHPVPGLAGAPTAPPLIPPYASASGALSMCKSKYVKMGG